AGEEERARLEDLLNYEDPKFTFFEAPLPDAHILSDEIELGLRRLDSPPGIERWEVVARRDSPTSRRALRLLQQRLAARNIERLQYRLRSRGLPDTLQLQADVREISLPEEKKSSYLSALVPLVLVLMTITGAVYPAIDLTAGERERGTLQI